MENDHLIERIMKKDANALEKAIEIYGKLVWTVVCGILSGASGCTREDAEECVSDTFLALWQHPEKYEPERGTLKSYLCLMARSKALNLHRQKSKLVVAYMEDFAELHAEEAETPEDYTELYGAVAGLPEPTRTILIRRYFFGEKPRRIAEQMELPRKEVENRLYRGKQTLAAQLLTLQEVEG